MSDIIVPDTTFNIVTAPASVANAPQRVLFVGQKTASGTAVSGALTTNVGVDGEEDGLFGSDSMLAAGIRSFRALNNLTRVDTIALDDDAGGTEATATITVTGPSLVSGTITLSVQSAALHTVTVSVSPSDTADIIAAAINAALSALTGVMFTSSVTTNVVTLTCAHKGTVGNDLLVKVSETIPGVSLTITAFAGGATDPDLTNVFDVTGEFRYQTVVFPSNYSFTQLKEFLDSRFNVQGRVLDGVAIMSDSLATVSALTSKYGALNTYATVVGNKLFDGTQFKGGGQAEFDFVVAAKVAAIRALRLTPGANVSRYVVGATATVASRGGPAFATVPYANTPLPTSTIIDSSSWWTRAEQLALNDAGISVIGNSRSQTEVVLGEFVTLKTLTNSTFKFLNALDGASVAREYFYDNNLAQYAQVKLSPGEKVQGSFMVNAEDIKLYQLSLYEDLADLGITPKGTQFNNTFRDNLVVTINYQTGEVTLDAVLPLVSAIRTIVGRLNITFPVN